MSDVNVCEPGHTNNGFRTIVRKIFESLLNLSESSTTQTRFA